MLAENHIEELSSCREKTVVGSCQYVRDGFCDFDCWECGPRVPRTLEKRVRSWVRFQFLEEFKEEKVLQNMDFSCRKVIMENKMQPNKHFSGSYHRSQVGVGER
jgi:hypothetical protein